MLNLNFNYALRTLRPNKCQRSHILGLIITDFRSYKIDINDHFNLEK